MRTLAEIGQDLRAAREERGRTLEEVAAETRMKVSHLRAIEEGDESLLPEPVYIKSFIRKYAQAVGLPGDDLANQYWETKPLPPTPAPKQEISLPWWLFPWLIALVLIGVVIYFIAIAPRPVPEAGPLVTPSVAPSPASPSVMPEAATESLPAATASAPVPVEAPTPTPVPTLAPREITLAPGEELSLRLVVTETSWLRVLRDGQRVYEGTVAAGEAMAWTASEDLNVSIGNAGGVEVIVGDRSLGYLGDHGEVVRRIFKRGE